MTLPIPIVPAWAGFLGLPHTERQAFLAAAEAFTIAAAAMQADPAIDRSGGPASSTPGPAYQASTRPRTRQSIVASTGPAPAIAGSLGSSIPLIGGAALDLSPRAEFAKADFIRRWRPGQTILAYAASTTGLAPLMRPIGQSAYAVGVDAGDEVLQGLKAGTARDLSARMHRHNSLGHGSVSKADPRVRTPGFTSWTPEPLPVATLEPSPMSPVSVRGDALEITLPVSMTPAGFDRRFATALAGASLAGWAMSADGRAICKAHAVDPWSLVRGTPSADGSVAWCAELILIKVRRDALRLVRVCEQIIIDHVAAEPAIDAVGDAAGAHSSPRRTRAIRPPDDRGAATAPTAAGKELKPRRPAAAPRATPGRLPAKQK